MAEIEIGAVIVAILFLWLGSVEIRIRSKISKDTCEAKSSVLKEISQRLFRIESNQMGGKK